jgi:hypothetical protein
LSARPNDNQDSRLSRLFEIGFGNAVGWGEGELANILDHQLRAPILADLQPNATLLQSLGLGKVRRGDAALETFGDLLKHPRPPLLLLQLAKEFAKTADNQLFDPLPPPVAEALYLLIIAAALVRNGQRITTMDDEEFLTGLEWLANQQWIAAPWRELAADAQAALGVS